MKTPMDNHTAGEAILALAKKKTSRKESELFAHEAKLTAMYVELNGDSDVFRLKYLEAIQATLEANLFRLARGLVQAARAIFTPDDYTQVVSSTIKAQRDETDSVELMKTLLHLGVPVSNTDRDGNTPLYLCCLLGRPRLFELLMEGGADHRTLHDSILVPDNRDAAPPQPPESSSLLQVALNAKLSSKDNHYLHYQAHGFRRWEWDPIITSLLLKGLAFDADHPMIANHLAIACYIGRTDIIDSILRPSDRLSKPSYVDMPFFRAFTLPVALASAAQAGSIGLVLRLLGLGADPRLDYPAEESVPAPFKSKQLFGAPFHSRSAFSNALFHITNRWPKDFNWDSVAECLVAMVVFDDEPIDVDDECRKLLEQCFKYGHADAARHLLDRGVRLRRLDVTNSAATVRLCLEYGMPINWEAIQKQAISEGWIQDLQIVLQENGLSSWDDKDELMRFAARSLDKPDVLRFLINHSGLDINATFKESSNRDLTSLLSIAIANMGYTSSHAYLLIELGADPEMPGLPCDAGEATWKAASAQFVTVEHFCNKFLTFIRLIERTLGPISPSRFMPKPIGGEDRQQHADDGWNGGPRGSHDGVSEDNMVLGAAEAGLPGIETNLEHVGSAQVELLSVPIGTEDVITTPNGDPYQYTPMGGVPDTIRLVELESSTSTDDPINFRLLHSSISQGRPFEILTGYWGSGADLEAVILSDSDESVRVTIELAHALRRVRLKTESRFLWIRPIGINDRSLQEKNQQMAMLRDIYMSARRLLIWLGEAADRVDLVFNFLEEHSIELNKAPCRDPCFDDEPSGPCYESETKVAYETLCRSAWFYQSWTRMELWLCRDMTVICGQYQQSSKADDASNVLERLEMPYLPYRSEIGHRLGWYAHSQVENGPERLSQLAAIHESAGWPYQDFSHFKWGSSFDGYHARDVRDVVYSIAALSERPPIKIDYGASLAAIFRDITEVIIDDLDILNLCSFHKTVPGLLSWVPDYTHTDPLRLLTSSTRSTFPGDEWASPRVDGRKLVLQGIHIETIHDIGHAMEQREDHMSGADGIRQLLNSWEAVAAGLRNKKFEQNITDGFQDTIVAEDLSSRAAGTISWNHSAFRRWYAVHGNGILRQADEDWFDKIGLAEAWVSTCQTNSEGGESDWDRQATERYGKKMREVCYGRRFFITEEGNMGLAPVRAETGDRLVFFPTTGFPFQFCYALRPREGGMFSLLGACYLYKWDVKQRFEAGDISATEIILI